MAEQSHHPLSKESNILYDEKLNFFHELWSEIGGPIWLTWRGFGFSRFVWRPHSGPYEWLWAGFLGDTGDVATHSTNWPVIRSFWYGFSLLPFGFCIL